MYLLYIYIYIYIYIQGGVYIHTYIYRGFCENGARYLAGNSHQPILPMHAGDIKAAHPHTTFFSFFEIFVQEFEKWRETFGAKNVHTHQRVIASTTRGGHTYIHTMCICTARTYTRPNAHTSFTNLHMFHGKPLFCTRAHEIFVTCSLSHPLHGCMHMSGMLSHANMCMCLYTHVYI